MLVSAAGLLAAGLLSACGTLTTDFVFVTSAKAAGTNSYGEIDIFEINSDSGKMRQIPASPVPSGGRNPVAETVSADYSNLFVVNRDDNTLVQFVIGSDGKLYPTSTINTPGIYPIALTMNSSYLFVADTYQPLATCSSVAPCSGSVSVLPVTAASGSTAMSLGTAITNAGNGKQYWPLNLTTSGQSSHVITPTAVTVSGSYVFVSAYDATPSTTVGYIFAYSVLSSGVSTSPAGTTCAALPSGTTTYPAGTLCPVTGSPFVAGVKPSSLSVDGSGKYLYAADATGNSVLGFSISNGILTAVSGSPWAAGNAPSSIVVDPAYNYLYVANGTDSNVTGYSISNGQLTRVATYATGSNPVAIGIDPSKHHFLYTANFLSSNVSGWKMDTTDGTLLVSQGSPFTSNANPTAVAAVPHK